MNHIIVIQNNNYLIEFIYFENNETKCFNNVAKRNDARIISKEGLKSFNYTIPKNIKTKEIYQL